MHRNSTQMVTCSFDLYVNGFQWCILWRNIRTRACAHVRIHTHTYTDSHAWISFEWIDFHTFQTLADAQFKTRTKFSRETNQNAKRYGAEWTNKKANSKLFSSDPANWRQLLTTFSRIFLLFCFFGFYLFSRVASLDYFFFLDVFFFQLTVEAK